ncbi:MAG: hypothetical protein P1V35_12790, partial [Planctomycetota bacterium]|nr:hypothetical protein [Planctomycetota bacterium]
LLASGQGDEKKQAEKAKEGSFHGVIRRDVLPMIAGGDSVNTVTGALSPFFPTKASGKWSSGMEWAPTDFLPHLAIS